MGKAYSKITGTCEFVYDREIVIRNDYAEKLLVATVLLELCDENKVKIDTVNVEVRKTYDHAPTLVDRLAFTANEVAAAIKAKKEEYSGFKV